MITQIQFWNLLITSSAVPLFFPPFSTLTKNRSQIQVPLLVIFLQLLVQIPPCAEIKILKCWVNHYYSLAYNPMHTYKL